MGLLPLCATTVVEKWQRERIPQAAAAYLARLRQMPELLESIHPTGPGHYGLAERGILALINPERLRRILSRMLDENEFLSPYGIRSISKFHDRNRIRRLRIHCGVSAASSLPRHRGVSVGLGARLR